MPLQFAVQTYELLVQFDYPSRQESINFSLFTFHFSFKHVADLLIHILSRVA